MKRWLVLILIGCLLVGCGVNKTNTSDDDDNVKVEDEQDEDDVNEDEDEEAAPGSEIFSQLPDSFSFCSGAGAWETTLHLEDDGTFYGQYHDANAGEIGDGYPNGTVYISGFTGKFTAPVKVNDYTYSTTVEYLKIDREGEEYIEDGIKYIVTDPYGIDGAEEVLFYMHGAPTSDLPDGFMEWVQSFDVHPEGELLCYGLYNVNEEDGFVGYKRMPNEDVEKLDGTYIGENGDNLVIHLEITDENYYYDIGEVEWTPNGGEMEIGNIMVNKKGGFTIYLDASISYDFEISDNTEGHIELKRINMSETDIFKMQ